MNQHTPGPWVVKTTVIGPEASIKVIGTKQGDLTDQSAVCLVPQTNEEQVHNTKLIIAAPELLAALRGLTYAVARFTNADAQDWPEIQAARAALIKAGDAE